MHDFYITKFFQKLFFGNSGMGQVLLITLTFLLNLTLVFVIDGFAIHSIAPDDSRSPDFSAYIDGEILDSTTPGGTGFILYRGTDGNRHLATIKENRITWRYRIVNSRDLVISEGEDPFVYETGSILFGGKHTVTVSGDEFIQHECLGGGFANETLSAYMLIALASLLVELAIFRKIKQ